MWSITACKMTYTPLFNGLITKVQTIAKAFLDFTLVGHCIVQRRATILCSDSKDFKRRADEGLANDIVRRLT